MTSYVGIDWSNGTANKDQKTGIRYGVINQHEVLQAWADSSEAWYGDEMEYECKCGKVHSGKIGNEIECECGEVFDIEIDKYAEPISFFVEDNEYSAECGESGDIFITKSPYYTYAQFCSPCAPGACYLMNTLDELIDDNKCYCFGHDWFEDGRAPYNVYSVVTGELVEYK
jgi:hypothetical protein